MIDWLEEQEEISDIHICKLPNIWYFGICLFTRDTPLEGHEFSRKEATLAAIDAALEYLSNK